MDTRRADILAALLNGRLLCNPDTDTIPTDTNRRHDGDATRPATRLPVDGGGCPRRQAAADTIH